MFYHPYQLDLSFYRNRISIECKDLGPAKGAHVIEKVLGSYPIVVTNQGVRCQTGLKKLSYKISCRSFSSPGTGSHCWAVISLGSSAEAFHTNFC